jgi:hypothetical protein
MKMSGRELTKTLRALADANAKASRLRAKVAEHCEAVYGVDPGDVDCDEFIDSCDAGSGGGNGMTAKQFHEAMSQACERAGIAF